MTNSQGVVVQSVDRALEIIECFTGSVSELGITELSERMALSKSTVYGLVNTLVGRGYLEQNMDTKRYRLGLKLFELGNLVQKRLDLRTEAKALCRELSAQHDATVHLASPYGGEILYIDKVDSPSALISYSQVGMRAPMYCTGVGKAILAYLPPDDQARYLETVDIQAFTPNTVRTARELAEDLERIRHRGYALDNEEIQEGLRCVAAPIFNHKGEPMAAVSVSKTHRRLDEGTQRQIAQNVMRCAEQITRRMGGRSTW